MGAVSLRRVGDRLTEDVRRTTGRGGQQGGVPDRASRCRALGKRGAAPSRTRDRDENAQLPAIFTPGDVIY